MNTITIRLSPEAPEPLYEQLYKYIKTEITNGNYPYQTKLPSKRQLSSYLQCSQNTVQNAYSQLVAEGYIMSKPKSGYYVSKLDGVLTITKKSISSDESEASDLNCKYDFSHSGIDFESFPFSTWRKITKSVINEYDTDLLKPSSPQGNFNLRSSIASYLHNSRGVNCSPEQIIVSSGTEFLLQLLIQIFHKDCIYAIEDPGYEKLNMIFKSNRAKYVGIPLDESGMLPDALLKSNADVACVTPSHQFPTGNIMPIGRRIQLLNWANQIPKRYIIEDDYDSEFKYSGKPIPSLQGLDSGGKVIYIGSFSKSLTPAIRISYMVLPKPLLKIYIERLNFYLCPVPSVEQKVMHYFINEGYFERHLNKMRNLYKKKRESLISAIYNLLPDAEVEGADAGLHVILKIKNGMNEEELVAAAQNQGVKVYGFSKFYLSDIHAQKEPLLLLGFASLSADEIYKAVNLLYKAYY